MRNQQKLERDKKLTFSWRGLTDDHLQDSGFPVTGNERLRACRRAIVAELLIAAEHGGWLCYSRRKGYYSELPAYAREGFPFANLTTVVEELLKHKWIEEKRARPGDLGWQSQMRATREMLQRLAGCTRLINIPIELIIRKNDAGIVTSYRDKAHTRGWRREAMKLNEALASSRIELSRDDLSDDDAIIVDPERVQCSRVSGYRVFNNNSWKRGGRFYGPFWQSVSPEGRLKLTIDGSRVTEPDFRNIHPQLLYELHGFKLHGDAYTIKGYENERPVVKKAGNMMINASSRSAAVGALVKKVRCDYRRAQAICIALDEHHKDISRSFNTGVGLSLQAIDAELMMRIALAALKDGIVALPIHDSFLVPIGRSADKVQQHMHDALDRTLCDLRR